MFAGSFTQRDVKEQGNSLRQCVKWCLTRMSHSVFVHYIFNILLLLLLLLLLIGFLYPMLFIYKDTKKYHVCNFNNISPSFNIQSYFINSVNKSIFSTSPSSPSSYREKLPSTVRVTRRVSHTVQCFKFKMENRHPSIVWSVTESRPSGC